MTNQAEITVLGELARSVERGTRAEFAKTVGIGQAYLSQILSGKRPLSRLPAGTLLKFSRASGIPLERLAAEEEGPAETPTLAPREGGDA